LNNPTTILIFTDWYIPGYRAGGPIQSVYNLAKLLSNNCHVKVVTRNTDYASVEPYTGVVANTWTSIGNQHEVLYISSEKLNLKTIRNLCKTHKADVILINGLFSFYFSILPLFFANFYGATKTFVAVRGMLHQSALKVKPLKKQLFLAFARGFGLYKTTTLLSTSPFENEEIVKTLGKVKIVSAPNIPLLPDKHFDFNKKQFKSDNGVLRLLFLGRISPEKNPVMVLKALSNIKESISIKFAGAGIDTTYQEIFNHELMVLPENVQVECLKELPHNEILALFDETDVMILPSHGENFGHAIFESMAHATPVIISNNTPWKQMQQDKAGIEVNADSAVEIGKAIAYFQVMEPVVYLEWQIGALNKALAYMDKNDFEKTFSKIFNS
jgi:glycosyltransferase involved in cell wall biosynthesis